MRKATNLRHINQAVRLNEPVSPEHEFYTDFSGLRGEFEEKVLYKSLEINAQGKKLSYDFRTNAFNKSLVFLGGMRGTGKTSELLGYQEKLHHSECFFVVFCRLDDELNINDMEYMDILILQLEKLTELLKQQNIKVDKSIVSDLQKWFAVQVKEINKSLAGEIGLNMGGGLNKSGLWSNLLGIFGELKASVIAGTQRTTSVRTVLKNNFIPFKDKFNEFVSRVAIELRKAGVAKDILFIIDGLEKTTTPDIRRRIIIDEARRITSIKANTLFILPIELMKERQLLRQLTDSVFTFPNIKIIDRQGNKAKKGEDRLLEFVYKRVDKSLFIENEDDRLVKEIIYYSGGNPRELLRILTYVGIYSDDDLGKIDTATVDKALDKLARETAQYLTQADFNKLRELKENNERQLDTTYDAILDKLLEEVIIYEYNDGTHKRVNPILQRARIYQQQVES